MNNRGQSGLEYGIFFTMAVLALVAMIPYARRCISGGLKRASEYVSEKHYDARATNGTSSSEFIDSSNTFFGLNGVIQNGAAQNRQSGNETLGSLTP